MYFTPRVLTAADALAVNEGLALNEQKNESTKLGTQCDLGDWAGRSFQSLLVSHAFKAPPPPIHL